MYRIIRSLSDILIFLEPDEKIDVDAVNQEIINREQVSYYRLGHANIWLPVKVPSKAPDLSRISARGQRVREMQFAFFFPLFSLCK